jgi:taurine dioxygenase
MHKATERTYRHIDVQPVAGSLGAEIRGVNVTAASDGEVISEIRQAFLDHLVLFIRDQTLTPHEQLAFARRFGEPMEYPQLTGLPECPVMPAVDDTGLRPGSPNRRLPR